MAAGAGRVVLAPRRDCRESTRPAHSHRRSTTGAGRVVPPRALSRHEVTLVEFAPAGDEDRPWSDARRLPGREAA
ncbi:hypothetical protein [Streptomyces sp. NPDC007991]|uniref:hypothetical protein n=1 Tax=Streptomyces sp. NPDC007991 TaxID=3364803 RepID=UPI0036E228B0